MKHALFAVLGAIAVLTAAPIAMAVPAYAVDDIEGADAPDLTAVKAKIDAIHDYFVGKTPPKRIPVTVGAYTGPAAP